MFKDWYYLSSEITSQDRLFLRFRHHQHLIRPAYSGARSFFHVAEVTRQSPGICLVVEEHVTEYHVRLWRHPLCQSLDTRQNASFRSCGRRDWRQKG